MWKIVLGFIVFAALAMYVVMKGGDKIDMGGEKHGVESHAPAAAHAPAATSPAEPASPAPAASEAKK